MADFARVRKSAVAGSFYPGDPGALRNDLDALLANAAGVTPPGRPIVLVEPHAGYVYSGTVAAHGYKLLEHTGIGTVVVISPSHREYFPFLSVFDGDAYETPLGVVPVDKRLSWDIVKADELLRSSGRGHIQNRLADGEHALEVQLPFLQAVLDKFQIVPVVMGDQSWEACRVLGDALGPLLKRPDALVVASSDLSHFYPYDVAKQMDDTFLDLLKRMDPWHLYESVKRKSCEACGAGPVIAAMIAAQHVDSATCRVLATANSGDVTGDHDRVVGYASAVIFEPNRHAREELDRKDYNEVNVGKTERAYLLESARRSIETALGIDHGSPPSCDSPLLEQRHGAFVTLKLNNRLRGCIGAVEPQKSVRDVIADVAMAAAFNDHRFKRLSARELEHLYIEISILSPLHRIRDPREIEIGRHGLVVRRGKSSGLLLPQVAEEHGWDAIEFLELTCEKASLPRDAWKDEATRIYVFAATVFGEEREFKH
jgi:AmmeMemoRadiSam system protein B/AmmeMemoRadiSam system protein A